MVVETEDDVEDAGSVDEVVELENVKDDAEVEFPTCKAVTPAPPSRPPEGPAEWDGRVTTPPITIIRRIDSAESLLASP